jgi:hypothetical protein
MPTVPTLNPATNSTYTKRDLATAPEAFKASLEIMFCHMADMFNVVLDVLAEKYGHSKEEMLATLVAHPSYQSLPRHPVLDSLGYFGEADLALSAPLSSSMSSPLSAPASIAADATTTAPTGDPPKKIVVRRKKLKLPATASTSTE